ncbi:MAG TPA: type II secretion system F family protein [Candidatus Dormibacteraeota bacterium]|nr:type II secretion system F family protein [Candidatus Dormibacteraeota bacterium]
MALLVAFFTFLAVLAIILLFFTMGSGTPREQIVRKRFEAVQRAERRGDLTLGLQLVRDELLSDVPALNKLLVRWNWANRLRDYIEQAGVKSKPGKILLVSFVAAVGVYLIVAAVSPYILIALAAGLIAASIPMSLVSFKRKHRFREFEKHFPEALDLLARAVRAGHAITTGLEMVGKEMGEPVAGEFRTTFEEQNFGLPLRDALLNMTERIPLLDVRFFVTAMLIQKETGGNLAEILDNLSRVIRERFRIRGEVRIRTAQGRMTAGILIALPPIMMFMLNTLNPEYMKPLFTEPLGHWMLLIAGVLQLVGSIILWKIVHIEV